MKHKGQIICILCGWKLVSGFVVEHMERIHPGALRHATREQPE